MILTAQQVQALLRQVGFPESSIVIMTAICKQESSYNTNAINDGSGTNSVEYSVGLFQINTRVHKNFTIAQLKDPVTNAREALRIYNSQGLRAWGAYSSGLYKKYLPEAQAAAGNPSRVEIVPANDGGSAVGAGAAIGAGGLLVLGLIAFLVLD